MTAELEHDWYPRALPDNVVLGERCWLHSAHALVHCASVRDVALAIGDDSGVYHGTHFDIGPQASVVIGRCCTIVGAIVRTDGDVRIGDHVFISHEVVIADGPWAVPPRLARGDGAAAGGANGDGARIDIGDDVWIGARATIIGDVRIGAGAIVGAGAVVTNDVPAGAVVAGNPAEVVRSA
jgi:acetyltransferase-like isoleucine patch superfamily enzyme